ncbi:MAG: hypothetical protein AAFR44_07030, partial [Pseudomonadota bacterium]
QPPLADPGEQVRQGACGTGLAARGLRHGACGTGLAAALSGRHATHWADNNVARDRACGAGS